MWVKCTISAECKIIQIAVLTVTSGSEKPPILKFQKPFDKMGLGSDFEIVRQECRGLLRMGCPVALKVGSFGRIITVSNTLKYEYIILLLKCLYKINHACVKICFTQNKPQPLPCTPLCMSLYPLCRAGLDLLSTFVLTLACDCRERFIAGEGYPQVVASAPNLPVAWAIMMLSCGAKCFNNIVLALAVTYLLFVLLVF